jgi:L-rhamnose mutarotase
LPNKQHILTLELRDDDELIGVYEQYHQPGHVWPEILKSIKESGIVDMQIYRSATFLVMLLETTNDFSFEKKFVLDSCNARVQEWEKLMDRFQHVDTADPEQGKWRPMLQIFSLAEH